ncbi:transposase, MuDR, MULE transposase domain protein [Tanacetum coccineum]
MLERQIYDENDDENVPLSYHINKDFSIPFGREEFCLVTGLRFGVQNWAKYDTKERIPFRRRVFPSYLDGKPITGIDIANTILDQSFAQLYDDDMLRLANDRVAWDKYLWGSYVWPTLYSQLTTANVKRWSPLYVDEPTDEDDAKNYSIFGYTWAFKGNMPAARLTPNDNEARSDWWISSRAYFDGFIGQVERVPFDLSCTVPDRSFRVTFKSPRAFEEQDFVVYCSRYQNEGTITRIKTDDKGVFEMLFIVIGASIRTFLNYLRLVLMIDAAHLKGLYKGKNLVAVAMDGNNQIVPIAFGICKGETGLCWSCRMSVLKECIGDNSNLLFISDRHAAIAMAIENEFPLAFHAVCCWHLMQNLSLKNKKRKGLFWKICKAYTREDYVTSMNILQIVQPEAYKKLCRAGPQRWSRAHCPLVRYNYMTSNSVESVIACSVIYRKEPVLKSAETYRAMVQEWYYKRRQLAANMTYEITD